MAGKILILRLLKSLIMFLLYNREFADYCSVLYIVNNERFAGFYDKRTQSSYFIYSGATGKMFKVGEMNYLVSGSFDEYSVFPLETSSLLEKEV